jgi:hypothetical protein
VKYHISQGIQFRLFIVKLIYYKNLMQNEIV